MFVSPDQNLKGDLIKNAEAVKTGESKKIKEMTLFREDIQIGIWNGLIARRGYFSPFF
jgi:hypothetical protein